MTKPKFTIPTADWPDVCLHLADRKCKKCHGSGRTGFIHGAPIPCFRCVRREYADLEHYQDVLEDRVYTWREAFAVLGQARDAAKVAPE